MKNKILVVIDFLKELSEVQTRAVKYIDGPSLVIAGAGSGKTRVLTYKIAFLISNNVRAKNILALTFTNKAAKEMRERIINLVDERSSRDLWMGTFHSLFSKILRIESEKLGGYSADFTIYDAEDSKSVIASIIKEMELDKQEYKPADIQNRISMAKNNLITAGAYEANVEIIERDRQNRKPLIFEIYKRYALRCRKSNAMDFDDLLLNTNILFRDNPDVLAKYQDKFRYILVDEYQDTNFAQYLIIKKLAAVHKNICVVGDDSQSIYSFRGAKIENILNFKIDYPEHQIFKLEQNYRSTQSIVEAANSLIENNRNKIPKKLWSENEFGSKIKVIKAFLDFEEGFQVANEIADAIYNREANYNEIAILYRINSQSRVFEESLRKRNIPYRIFGGLSFYQRKEIKDVLAYFRIIINSKDDEAIKRVINFPNRKIGDVSLEKMSQFASANEISLWDVITNIENFDIRLQQKAKEALRDFVKFLSEMRMMIENTDAFTIANQIIIRSGIYSELFKENSPEGIDRKANIEELLNGIRSFVDEFETEGVVPTLSMFLESVALLTDADNDKNEDNNKVKLMTVHSAKGLEFGKVFIVGAEEDLFPFYLSKHSSYELEEERRLFYVAITRARKSLTISYSERRFRSGEYYDCRVSRFLSEIDAKYIDLPNQSEKNKIKDSFEEEFINYSKAPQRKGINTNISYNRKVTKIEDAVKKSTSVEIPPENIEVGMVVEHERFGKGKVISIEGVHPNAKAIVDFEKDGKKNLLLKFAKLKILD